MRRPYLFGVTGYEKAAAPGSAAAKMLMCGKATRKNLTGARPLFRRMKMAFRMESVLDIMGCPCYNEHTERKLSIRREVFMKNRLEELRKERGIKQEKLAADLEVSRQTIGSLENGRYNPSILLAFKIARYFGMSIEEIFIYEEDAK